MGFMPLPWLMSFSETSNYFWVGAILAEFWTNSGGSLSWTKLFQQHLEKRATLVAKGKCFSHSSRLVFCRELKGNSFCWLLQALGYCVPFLHLGRSCKNCGQIHILYKIKERKKSEKPRMAGRVIMMSSTWFLVLKSCCFTCECSLHATDRVNRKEEMPSSILITYQESVINDVQ